MEPHTCQAHTGSFLPHAFPPSPAAICPCVLIVLWKLSFPPSLNTASRTYSSSKPVPQCHLPHVNLSRHCHRGLGAMCTALARAPLSNCFSITFLPVLLDLFLWLCKPHLKLHFTFPKLYILLPQQCYLLDLQKPCVCLHQLRETPLLAYTAFNYHTFIHKRLFRRKCLATRNSSVEEVHYIVPRSLPKRQCKEENTEPGDKMGD